MRGSANVAIGKLLVNASEGYGSLRQPLFEVAFISFIYSVFMYDACLRGLRPTDVRRKSLSYGSGGKR
jgi:hypothetical protein